MKTKTLEFQIQVVPVGQSFIAVTNIGGIVIKGYLATDSRLAVISLFRNMCEGGDPAIAVELALAGSTLMELTEGKK